jgi:hypothetical protein
VVVVTAAAFRRLYRVALGRGVVVVQVGDRAGVEGCPVGQHVGCDDRRPGQRGERDPGGRPPGAAEHPQRGGGDAGNDVQAVPVTPGLPMGLEWRAFRPPDNFLGPRGPFEAFPQVIDGGFQ